jgi:hypothetical protein
VGAGLGRFHALLLAMALSRAAAGLVFPLLAVLFKWAILGRSKPGRYPLWGECILVVVVCFTMRLRECILVESIIIQEQCTSRFGLWSNCVT